MAALFSGSAGHRPGGLHLGGAFFTPAIGPTVRALTELAPC